MVNKKANKIIYIIIFSLTILLNLNNPSIFINIVLFSIFILFSIIKNELSFLMFLFLIPFNNILRENMQINIFSIHPSIIFFVLFLLTTMIKDNKFIVETKISKPALYFVGLFISFNIFALVLNVSNLNLILSYYGSFFVSILTFIFVIMYIKNGYDFQLLLKTIIISNLTIIIFVAINIEFDINNFSSRLKFDDNVRLLANNISLPIVFLSFYLINEKREKLALKRILSFAILAIFLFALIWTGSRGVLYSTLIMLFIMLLLNFKKNKIYVSLAFGMLSMILIILKTNSGNNEILDRLFDLDNTSRINIWKNAFELVEPYKLVFGGGLNSFTELSLVGGMVSKHGNNPWYAHSLFFDVLFSSGFFSLITLGLFILVYVKKAILNKQTFVVIIMVFTILLFLTHGETHSINFWINLGLSVGLIEYKNITENRRD